MEEKIKNKYVIFPICIIIAAISVSSYTYINGTYNTSEAIEKFDITGMSMVFLIMMLVFHIIIAVLCLYKGLKISDEGYDYRINTIIAILFVVLAIISILSFVIIRNEEETQALTIQQELEEALPDVIVLNSNRKSKTKTIAEKQQEDPYYARKMQIISQIDNNTSKFERYMNLFIYLPMYNDNTPIIINAPAEKCYYGIFSKYTIIDIIFCIIYFINSKDNDKESKTKILS